MEAEVARVRAEKEAESAGLRAEVAKVTAEKEAEVARLTAEKEADVARVTSQKDAALEEAVADMDADIARLRGLLAQATAATPTCPCATSPTGRRSDDGAAPGKSRNCVFVSYWA